MSQTMYSNLVTSLIPLAAARFLLYIYCKPVTIISAQHGGGIDDEERARRSFWAGANDR